MHENYDIVIVGAGPAGCACAYQLIGRGLKIAVIEKGTFPRDKICGDALSKDVINQFYRMNPDLANTFLHLTQKTPSYGVRFFAPNHKHLDIAFKNEENHSPGFVAKRYEFDNFFFNQIKDAPGVSVFQNHTVTEITYLEDKVLIKTKDKKFTAKIIIGADGAYSVVNKQLSKNKVDKKHYCAGLRQYYENVNGFHEGKYVELHFYKELLPGYFWIFPLPNNQANVGVGMLSSAVSKRKINLKEKFADILHNHPNVKERFKNARPLEPVRGFGLPIGSKKRACSGDRYLLLGDAASLIDPFTGEGIGNAIRSGRVAADHLLRAFDQNCFHATFNKAYDKEIYSRMWNELRVSRSLQTLSSYPRLFDFVVNKAQKNKSIQLLLTSMLDDLDLKKELTKPGFYFKLLFN